MFKGGVLRAALLAALFSALITTTAARAERVALTIGIGAYAELPELANTPRDAAEMANALREAGYQVIAAPANATAAQMTAALEQFYAAAQDAETALFYFSGHGAQSSDGSETYIFPADVAFNPDTVRLSGLDRAMQQSSAFEIANILTQMRERADVAVMLLDSCRNPIGGDKSLPGATAANGTHKGLSFVSVAETDPGRARGAFVGFATAAGQVANEGPAGGLSFYTAALTAAIREDAANGRARDVAVLHRAVAATVRDATGAAQQPESRPFGLTEAFSLTGTITVNAQTAAAPPPEPDTTGRVVDDDGVILIHLYSMADDGYGGVSPQTPRQRGRRDEGAEDRILRRLLEHRRQRQQREAQEWEEERARRRPLSIDEIIRRYGGGGGAPPPPPQTDGVDSADLAPGDVFKECAVCPEMVVIAGVRRFVMGSPSNEPGRENDEGPLRFISVPQFAMARTETTFGHWEACVLEGGCPEDSGIADRGLNFTNALPIANPTWRDVQIFLDFGLGDRGAPVVQITYSDALAYIAWLNTKVEGEPYRLPSEAEWEFAARGSTTLTLTPPAHWWGAEFDRAYANASGVEGADQWEKTAPVGSFLANGFGLHDMIGNVREWTGDCYGDYADAPTDGSPRVFEGCTNNALRGGSWGSTPPYLRAANRGWSRRENRANDVGFRVARTAP